MLYITGSVSARWKISTNKRNLMWKDVYLLRASSSGMCIVHKFYNFKQALMVVSEYKHKICN